MDKELSEKELLERLYKFGYRYIARDSDRCLYAYCRKPKKMGAYWVSEAKSTWLFLFEDLFENVTFEDEEPFDIAKKLGVVDWFDVPIDTKVLVSSDNKHWHKRHFAKFDEKGAAKFIVYGFGETSWTSSGRCDDFRVAYEYCKLAEGE